MSLSPENIFMVGSILLMLSLYASKTSLRLGIPSLLLFLAVGMLAGSEGLGGIYFNNPQLSQFVGIIALIFILFTGGFETSWDTTKPILWRGASLSTIGVFVTTAAVGVFVWAITDFTIYEGLLMGAIVSSTDAAAVFSILRSKKIALKGNLRSLLELESGSNDPMAYFLTIIFTSAVMGQMGGPLQVLWQFIVSIIVGTIMGIVMGKLSVYLINNMELEIDSLYIILVIALIFFTYSASDTLHGNGFLSIYLLGIFMGNKEILHKKKILKSFDSYAWLWQIILFLTLGLQVFPSEILPIMPTGILISFFLILVARPISIWISLAFTDMKTRHKLFLSWVGLRGAVPIVFATYPLIAGIEKAPVIFHVVFFISVTSVLIQGTTIGLVAKWLHLLLPEKLKKKNAVDNEIADIIKSGLTRITLPMQCPTQGCQIVELNFPKTAFISMIVRNGKYIIPGGHTLLEGGDTLYVLSENEEALSDVYASLKIQPPANELTPEEVA